MPKKKESGSRAVSVWMTPAQHEQLAGLRKACGRSHSAIVCILLDEFAAGRIRTPLLPRRKTTGTVGTSAAESVTR